MGFINSDQILEQFSVGTQLLKVYIAPAGDLKAVVILPGEELEKQYSIELVNGYPKIIKETI